MLADWPTTQSRRTRLTRGNATATTYGYSVASQLTSLNHDLDGTVNDANWAFTYTAAGQAATRTLVNAYEWSVPALNQSYAVNGLNQYTSVAGVNYGYDRRGNLTGDGARSFSYDLENHLTSVVEGGATRTLNYDPLGRLRSIMANSVTTEFLYDGDRLVAEYDPNRAAGAQLLRRYVHGAGVDEPIVWYECPSPTPGACTSSRNWLIADRQGSIIASTDGAGGASIYRYGPYGEPESGNWTGQRFRYTGQIALPELRLYHYKARVYDPYLGRFLQTDPIGYADDLNAYSYGRGDPIALSDPSGLQSDDGCAGSRTGGKASSCSDDGANGGNQAGGAQSSPSGPPVFPGLLVRPPPTLSPVTTTATQSTEEALVANPLVALTVTFWAASATETAPPSSDTSVPGQQWVIRGGLASPQNLIDGTGPVDISRVIVPGLPPMTGFSVTTAPGMTPYELAMAARYRNGWVSATTVADLRALGYQVVPTPLPGWPLHATVVAPHPLPLAAAEVLSGAFGYQFQNPNRSR